jgi:hypothetical protein
LNIFRETFYAILHFAGGHFEKIQDWNHSKSILYVFIGFHMLENMLEDTKIMPIGKTLENLWMG